MADHHEAAEIGEPAQRREGDSTAQESALLGAVRHAYAVTVLLTLVDQRRVELIDPASRYVASGEGLTLRNRTDRPLRTELRFAVEAPSLSPGTTGQLEAVAGAVRAQWVIGPQYRDYTLPLEIPAASTVDVVFKTDAARVDAPIDTRNLVLRFKAGLRVYEAGCQKTT